MTMGKREKIILGILVVVIGVAIWYFMRDDSGGGVGSTTPTSVNDIESLEASFIDVPSDEVVDIFSTENFQRLDAFFDGNYTLEPKGTEDPFKPFTISKTSTTTP